MSDYIGDESAMIFVNIKRCTNVTDSNAVWKSEAAINRVINTQFLNVVTASS